MPEIATDQSQIVGDGDGGYFQISESQRGSRSLKSGAEAAADVSGLAVEEQNINRQQEDLLKIVQMKIGTLTFTGAIDNFGDSDGGNILIPRRNHSETSDQTDRRFLLKERLMTSVSKRYIASPAAALPQLAQITQAFLDLVEAGPSTGYSSEPPSLLVLFDDPQIFNADQGSNRSPPAADDKPLVAMATTGDIFGQMALSFGNRNIGHIKPPRSGQDDYNDQL